MSPRARPELRPRPTGEQRRAADPNCSVWVTASAGTGKTRVLADRVLRLLLAGNDPGRILCLTFTKAGAAEMVARIQADLARLATWPDTELEEDLRRLMGHPPMTDEIRRARTLLPEVLDLPAGLPVMTIHGFCQTLLHRFPLEAGVPIGFDVLEPRDQAGLLSQAQHKVLDGANGRLQQTIARLAVVLGEFGLAEGLMALRDHRLQLDAASAGEGDVGELIHALADRLGVGHGQSPAEIRQQICTDPLIDEMALRALGLALASGSAREQGDAIRLQAWLDAAPDARLAGLESYLGVFLKKDREPKKVVNAPTQAATPRAADVVEREQARLAQALVALKAATVLERTRVILEVGDAIMKHYARFKSRTGALDYDDLIQAAKGLLQGPGVASWVNYKLDRRIDHLLVDESQDTSPEQWAIALALADEFFVGEGAGNSGRTLFVVGDPKQSIFSFQGANLETFRKIHATTATRARAACAPWREEPLQRSFRCAKPILDAVDAVFDKTAAGEGVAETGGVRHESADPKAAGIVELWPLVPVLQREAQNGGWRLPDEQESTLRPEQRLATLIAEQIFRWRRDEIPLPGTKRAIEAGDVMVLLPRRGILQDLLIRELKRLHVPVAGADRLALIDELAVMDLMALGDAVLLPQDDLTLAAVLRSPLFDLSDDELFTLAHGRGTSSLFDRLRQQANGNHRFSEALERLREAIREADLHPPFEFYAKLLSQRGGRRRIERRLGRAAREPIEAFLAQALAYERTHPPSLQGFLQWLRADSSDLVRDPDQPRDEVRVLTVHGAKGLEAPIVFIADATFVPEAKDRLIWREEDGLPLWKVSRGEQDPVSRAAIERARARQLQEQRRLLYVAMTRARTWLIVTGWARKRQGEATWYDYLQEGLEGLEGTERVPMPDLEGEGLRLASQAPVATRAQRLPLGAPVPAEPPLPVWLEAPAPIEPAARSPLSPSRLAEDAPAATSPEALAEGRRFVRGRIVHRLLQTLPDLAPPARQPAIERYLAQPALGLGNEEARTLRDEVLAVLAMPALQPLFGPSARAEVPIVGCLGDDLISGQIDRLAITDDLICLLDYKTDRAPPAEPAAVPPTYLRQMAAYVALLARLHPGREIRAALVWTVGPRLMVLGETDLAPHLLLNVRGSEARRLDGAASPT